VKDATINEAEHKMKLAIENLSHEFSTIRTGRASPSLLDRVYVDYYGANTQLKQIASITTPEVRLLMIHPYDPKSLKDIERAILKSDLALTPSNDGTVIRLSIPQLTEERRRDLQKIVKGLSEDARVSIRNIRRDYNELIKKMEKNRDITEDDRDDMLEEVQQLTDKYIEKINQLLESKEKEIFEV
jgi:ribosome recycling factor